MPNCQYANFDITILGNDAPYTVNARFDEHGAEGVFNETLDDPFWQQIVERLGDVHQPAGEDQILMAGARLFESLMAGDIHRLWLHAETMSHSDGLRLRLAAQPPRVAALPWETLYDRNRGRLFAASGRTPLVRVENQLRYLAPARALNAAPPLKVLVAAADDATEQVNTEWQQEQLVSLLQSLPAALVQPIAYSGKFSVVDLVDAVTANGIDVLHLISHGSADSVHLWNNGEPANVRAGALRAALEKASTLRMIYLSACLAGRASAREAFTTVAPQLLQLGVPAVIAMQFAISDVDAAAFARLFYRELFSGPCPGAVDAALGYARSSQFALNADSFSFGTPVLWLNAHDGMIFQVDPTTLASTVPAPAPATTPVPNPPDVDIPTTQELMARLEAKQARIDLTRLGSIQRKEWDKGVQEYLDLVIQLEAMVKKQADIGQILQKLADIRTAELRLDSMLEQYADKSGDHPSTAHGAT